MLFFNAVRSGKKTKQTLPDWVTVIQLGELFHKLPSEIENESFLWVNRMTEYLYHSKREKDDGKKNTRDNS